MDKNEYLSLLKQKLNGAYTARDLETIYTESKKELSQYEIDENEAIELNTIRNYKKELFNNIPDSMFKLKEEGKLDEAYQLAISNYHSNSNDNFKRTMVWIIKKLCEKSINENKHSLALEYFSKISNLQFSLDELKNVNEKKIIKELELKLSPIGKKIEEAKRLYKEKDFTKAISIYEQLWQNYKDSFDEWDRNNYAWCIYYLYIKLDKIENEQLLINAVTMVTNLTNQVDKSKPDTNKNGCVYTLSVFRLLKYYDDDEKSINKPEPILTWTGKLTPDLLDKEPFAFVSNDGKNRELASNFEDGTCSDQKHY